jgi:carbon monoxide dehydrogenase subunit G
MTQFESDIKKAPHSDEKIFSFISDFNNFESLIPQDKVKDWQSTQETCRFKVEGIGEAGLKIVDKEPFKTVKYSTDGKVPFNFYLWVQLKQVEENDTRIKLTIKADLNPMMKMMVAKHVKKFLNMLGDAIANYHYPEK